MRMVLAALLVGACATVPPPAQRVAGCWIDRRPDGLVTTMRWLPDPERPEILRGAKLTYSTPNAPDLYEYTLEQTQEFARLCQLRGDAGERCWFVAEGDSGSLEGGRAFIDTHGERLRIAVFDGVERIIFQGARDGCD